MEREERAERTQRYDRAEREARARRRKKRRMIRRIKNIWNGITTLLVGIALVLAILIWGFRLIGMDVFIVQSGSMEPDYKVGGLVYVNEVDPETLEVGDVITFKLGEDTLGTHRIIEVLEENGAPAFRTKGDANDYEDNGLVTPDILVGQVKFTIPELGFLVTYIQQPPGTYFAFCAVAMLLILTILPDILFEDTSKKKKSQKNKKSSKTRADRDAERRPREDMDEKIRQDQQEDTP